MKSNKIEYSMFKEVSLEKRYLPPSLLKEIIVQRAYPFSLLGKSSEFRDIYLMHHGHGSHKILLWSQMHGNESTSTRAMLDIFKFLNSTHPLAKKISREVTIDYIPQLNPDGAENYTRRNAFQIDLNRDFIANSSIELPLLKNQVNKKAYQFLFNLHDQRSIFNPKNIQHPATLSFLSPAIDEKKEMNTAREVSMKLITSMYNALKEDLPLGIARFSDAYYPLATGDNFQKQQHPTILIECGHYPHDYTRNVTRKHTFYAIVAALEAIATNNWQQNAISTYHNIVENDDKAMDIIFRNVMVKNNFASSCIDLGIIYDEVLEHQAVNLKAKIVAVGDLHKNFGHLEIDAEQRVFTAGTSAIPQIHQSANFNLSDWKICNGQLSLD